MAAADTQAPPAEPTPALPDYLTSPNAVFGDEGVQWRYGRAPDYSKTRAVWEEGKKQNHAAGSLAQLVENLVKNWEVEASFKPRLQDWRTIDHENYTFAINGGPPQSAEHMLKVGTYNAIIAPNEYYSPENSDFASSHKTFKRMMPTFAWEVVEVYSAPPSKVAFKWRHWGVMKNDYVGFNDKGEKIVAKAHGGPIEIFGVTVAHVDDKVRLQSVDTWFDPLDMFRQIAPGGIVNKTPMNRNVDLEAALDADTEEKSRQANGAASGSAEPVVSVQPTAEPLVPSNDGVKIAEQHQNGEHILDAAPEDVIPKHISKSTGEPADEFVPHQGADTGQAMAATGDGAPSAAQTLVEAATTQGADAEIEHPESNFHDAHEHQTEAGSSGSTSVQHDERTAPAEASASTDYTYNDASTEPTKQDTSKSAADVPRSLYSSPVTGNVEDILKVGQTSNFTDESRTIRDAVDDHLEGSAEQVHPHPKDTEQAMQPQAGEAVAVPANTEETRLTHEEMSSLSAGECPFLMNRE